MRDYPIMVMIINICGAYHWEAFTHKMICIILVAGHNLLLESEISVIINNTHKFYD